MFLTLHRLDDNDWIIVNMANVEQVIIGVANPMFIGIGSTIIFASGRTLYVRETFNQIARLTDAKEPAPDENDDE